MSLSWKLGAFKKEMYILIAMWSLILMLLSTGTLCVRPPECTISIERASVTTTSKEGFKATCHLRTLSTSTFGLGNTSSISTWNHASQITSLILKCARQVVFQSDVEAGMFSIFPRLEDLTLLYCKLTSVPDHFLTGLPNLRRITVKAHHEDWPGASLQLSQFALSDLPRLEVLNLSYNNLWSFPSGNLCLLPSLTSLNLTYNSLHDLGDLKLGMDGCTHPISHLYLDHNQISEIRDRQLEGASSLRILTLSNNRISHLSDTAFEGLYELHRLDISKNYLVALPQQVFKDMKNVRDLNIANNSLTGLPPDGFHSLVHLLTLNISMNNLDLSINYQHPFKGLIRLVILDLSYNKMAYLGRETFSNLYSLQVLYINDNEISHLDDNTFSGLANLHELKLSNNKLSILTSKVFIGLSVLTYLMLDGNQISEVDDNAFINCSSLQRLDMSANDFILVPTALRKIPLLKTLTIGHNSINLITPNSFSGLDHLEELNLSYNKLRNLTAEAFKYQKNLKYLDISNNLISEVENGTLRYFPFLNGFNISHNKFKNLYGVVMSLHNLTWLNASHNQLEWFDYAVIPPNLIWIDISHNNLNKLGNHFKREDKINLKYVYASHNKITEIDGHSIPNKVEQIHLQYNMIDYIVSNTLKDKKNLLLINLSHNRLSIIGDSSIRLPPRATNKVPILYLSGNTLECDCGAEWLLQTLHENSQDVVGGSFLPQLGDITNVKCKLPGIWNNSIVPVVTVNPNQFLCTYRRHCFSVCHCCDFDACDCEQTCPRNCTCYHDHTWTHNIVDCGDGDWSLMPSGVPMDVTEAYMDGNNIGALTSHSLIGRKNLRILYLNNSMITVIQNKTFNGLKNLLTLKLSNNFIEKLYGYEFNHLQNLVELHLDYNKISFLGNLTFSHLRNLEVLRLDHNRLVYFPVWNFALNQFLIEVTLNHNPWTCECSFVANLRSWLEANRIKTVNGDTVSCFHNISKKEGPPILSESTIRCDHYLASNNIDSLIVNDYVMLITISISLILVILCGAFIVVVYRRRLKHWAISRYGKRLFDKPIEEENGKLFDAFISHSIKDSAWVCGLLAPELEAHGYHLCVAHRDCSLPSSPITSQAISESINCSRRVIIVVSKGYLDGDWCKYEFKSAHMEALRNIKRKHLIIVFLDEVSKSEFDTELNAILRSANTSLNPRDSRFWERLKRLLPKRRVNKRYHNKNDLNKTASYPLVATELTTCSPAWHVNESKTNIRAASPTLTVNPYWETAITSNVQNGGWIQPGVSSVTKPTWITPIQCSPIVASQETISKDGEHTYMSMSELGEAPSYMTDTKTIPIRDVRPSTKTLPKHPLDQNQIIESRLGNGDAKSAQSQTLGNHLLNRNAPDYLTRSWIFHHTQDPNTSPSQTYFV